MRFVLLLALLLPAIASAQLQLFLAPTGGEEKLVNAIHDMGSVAVAESSSVRFRLRNQGQSAVTLTALYAAGSGFNMTGAPTVPFLVAAGMNVDFTIRFSPPNAGSYSANLQVNGTGYILRGTGLGGATLRQGGQDLLPDSAIDFGRLERGTTSRIALTLFNTSSDSALVQSLVLTGSAFQMTPNQLSFPLQLNPGSSAEFEIVFTPLASGIASGSLTIDRRVFRLTGTAFEPALPRPTITIETPAIRSSEQGRVSVRLVAPSKSFVKGALRLELRPAGTIRDNDAAAMFTSGSRTVAFDIAPGDEVIRFRGETSAIFQAGTTAGTIVFVVEAGGWTEQQSVVVSPEPVRLTASSAVRSASGIDLMLTGFDNSRSLDDLSFTFYSNGQPLAGMPVRIAAGADFGRWWTTSTLGGVFQVKAAFPISGDASKVTGVDVKVTNSVGTTATERLPF
ncbi:MAG: choice-of-anchor D domain-containing protein [Bryobacteraceae bacterium]|nr:choice-of-anchor D domain-containing protein [Bryobacteraceae bacterium]